MSLSRRAFLSNSVATGATIGCSTIASEVFAFSDNNQQTQYSKQTWTRSQILRAIDIWVNIAYGRHKIINYTAMNVTIIQRDYVRFYIRNYFLEHDELPRGIQILGNADEPHGKTNISVGGINFNGVCDEIESILCQKW